MSFEKVLKSIEKFSSLNKAAQEQTDMYQFQNIIDKSFSQKDKNAIATKIANHPSIEEFNTLNVSLICDGIKISISAIVNGEENQIAKSIVNQELSSKKIPQNIKGSYNGWIKYPA